MSRRDGRCRGGGNGHGGEIRHKDVRDARHRGKSYRGDSDDDGIPDLLDNCLTAVNPGQENSDYYIDGDIAGDACDVDYDNDGLPEYDGTDLCPNLQSSVNADLDGDGVGDPCDNCPYDENGDQRDTDGDGIGDVCDA